MTTPPPERPEQTPPPEQDFPRHRIIGLADGVFAIALTLLVLELHVPELSESVSAAARHAEFLKLMNGSEIPVLWYLLTGLLIGGHWMNHSMLMQAEQKPPPEQPSLHSWFPRLNVAYLVLVGLMPWAMSLAVRYGDQAEAVQLYASLQFAIAMVMLRLLRFCVEGPLVTRLRQHTLAQLVAFVGMFVVAFWWPGYAWMVMGLLAGAPRFGSRWRQRRS